jgi:hypothetical protein
MKKPQLLTIIVVLLCFITLSFAQHTIDPTFEISSVLTCKNKKLNDYDIILSYDGQLEDKVTIKKSGKKTAVTLKRNEIYSIIFHKEGFDDKIIMINTNMPVTEEAEDFYRLNLQIEMHADHAKQKKEMVDFPVAVVKFEDKNKDFDFSERYHRQIYR